MDELRLIVTEHIDRQEELLLLWNEEYPVNLNYTDLSGFQSYLQNLQRAKHFLWLDAKEQVKAWAFTFDRENERWFGIILAAEIQGLGYGKRIMEFLQKTENELNGWITDHNHYVKTNGKTYPSPLRFYEKCGFAVLSEQRLVLPQLSAVKIHWKSNGIG